MCVNGQFDFFAIKSYNMGTQIYYNCVFEEYFVIYKQSHKKPKSNLVLWHVNRYLTNNHLILQPPRGQDVEWAFCFDVHLNAFFPLLMILHLFQLPFLNGKRSANLDSFIQ